MHLIKQNDAYYGLINKTIEFLEAYRKRRRAVFRKEYFMRIIIVII